MRLHRFTLIGLLALAFGCSGGQTGDLSGKNEKEGDQTGHNGTLGCEETREEIPFDEMTEQGSAEQLLAFAEADFAGSLTWREPAEGASWSVGPESGTVSFNVDVTRGAKAYRLSYAQKPNEQGQLSNAICPSPGLGVDAHVVVSTGEGALNEEYDTLLRAQGPHFASFDAPLDPAKVAGSLTVSSSNPKAKLTQLSLAVTLARGGVAAKISGIEQVELGEVAGAAPALLAVSGDEACASTDAAKDGFGFVAPGDVDALGITGEAAAELLSSMTPVGIDWEQSGASTELTVKATLTGVGCARPALGLLPEHAWGDVTYPALFAIESADGRVKSEYAGTLVTFPNTSGQGNGVSADAYVVFAPSQVADTGFSGIEVPQGVEQLVVDFEARRTGSIETGSIFLNGMSMPPCPMADPAPKPGMGASTPGCAGLMRQVLEAGTW